MNLSFQKYLKEPNVQEHFEKTPINSPEAFMGKEHFWRLVIEAGLSQEKASRTYQYMAFPCLQDKTPNHPRWLGKYPLDPAELGLVVASRFDVGMPFPPATIASLLRNTGSVYVLSRHQEALGHTQDDVERVVQVGSFIDLASRLSRNGIVEGLGRHAALSGMGHGGVEAAHAMAEQITASYLET